MKRFEVEISSGVFKIHGFVQEVGNDLLVSVWGGTKPHIGAVGIAIPRPSLKDPKTWGATSSNFTFLGHKEDTLAKAVSERLAAGLKRNVVAVVGIHWDRLTLKEIKMIQGLVRKMPDQILKEMAKSVDSSIR